MQDFSIFLPAAFISLKLRENFGFFGVFVSCSPTIWYKN
jgi:hypothetical protein